MRVLESILFVILVDRVGFVSCGPLRLEMSNSTLVNTTIPSTGGVFSSGALTRVSQPSATFSANQVPPQNATSLTTSTPLNTNTLAPNSTTTSTNLSSLSGSPTLNITLPSASNATQSNTSTNAATPSPSRFNPFNYTCSNWLGVADQSKAWQAVTGDDAVAKFLDMYHNDLQYCDECFGQPVDSCHSATNAPDCGEGLQSASKLRNGSFPRMDTAAGIFAGNSNDFLCEVEVDGGCDPGDCIATRGPAFWAITKSISNLHTSLHSVSQAFFAAHDEAQDKLGQFASNFAPLPKNGNGDTIISFFQTLFDAAVGMIPEELSAHGGVSGAVGIAEWLIDTTNPDQPDPTEPDVASILGDIVNKITTSYSNNGRQVFENGNYSGSSIADAMKNGDLLRVSGNENDLYPNLRTGFKRFIFQQLANLTWANYQVDDVPHFPFITFDPVLCEDLTPDNRITSEWLDDQTAKDTRISYQGRCYYLLDAAMYNYIVAPGDGGGLTAGGPECDFQALPGGTHAYLDSVGGDYGGLEIEDFIRPSVDGWAANGNNNPYKSVFDKGNPLVGTWTAGAVTIPVCDYSGDNLPKGCPNFQANDQGCIIS